MDFIAELKALHIDLNEKQLEQFAQYYELLIKWNEVMNLTGITEKDEVYLKHFYDSLTLCKALNLNEELHLCDVGSGAGFPAIPLKIAFPHLKVTIVDSLGKRVNFLNEVIKALHLECIQAFHMRAEDFAKEHRESFDVVTARALANVYIGLELCLPLVKTGGYFLPMLAKEEIKEEPIKLLGGKKEENLHFFLPIEGSNRCIIKIKKVSLTPKKYPRSFAAIKKDPLGR